MNARNEMIEFVICKTAGVTPAVLFANVYHELTGVLQKYQRAGGEGWFVPFYGHVDRKQVEMHTV